MALSAAERAELMKDVPTLEEYWAAHIQSKKELEEERKRSREEWEERRKQAEAEMEEIRRFHREFQKQLDRVDKQIGGLGNSIGGLVETLIAAKLWEKFQGTPYSRLKRAYRRVQVFDDTNIERTDIDILLSDSDLCMAVEVKREPDKRDVDDHVKRMGLIRKYPPAETKGKTLVAAIAGGYVPGEVRDYAHSKGFYVLELSGETVTLAEPPAGFRPREW
ncbi:MAG: hypothetical protein LBR23_05145 [Spirochaetaceae bacterium]|jgi:hypothetical protein|nr:hypothetical protein [Spirochaetaceae bacterium]